MREKREGDVQSSGSQAPKCVTFGGLIEEVAKLKERIVLDDHFGYL